MGTSQYTIKIFQEEDQSFYGEVIELPGCFSTGKTIAELKKNMKEAIECYLEGLKKDVELGYVSFSYFTQYA
ncbi:type II toxin-antitoxin system HicB family antitoxin [bacterium]|nr:type II toxin-antitoxin system HicB family antitoxin [bacterium]